MDNIILCRGLSGDTRVIGGDRGKVEMRTIV